MRRQLRRLFRNTKFRYFMLTWPLIFLVAAIAVFLAVREYALNPTAQAAPDQPIDFPHTLHASLLECAFCHRTANSEPHAGLPAIEQCMFCHQVVNPEQQAERADVLAQTDIPMVLESWNTGDPVDWERVHQMPDHVQFKHQPHISAGFECSTCHGDVQSMQKIKQVRDLRMEDCVTCHRENDAPTDCTTCHY